MTGGERTRRDGWRDLRQALSWHRRFLAAGLLAGSVAMSLTALSPAPPETVRVVAAEHDIAGGTRITPGLLTYVALAPEAVPAGSFRSGSHLVGEVLAAPVRKGETLTDLRLVGPALLTSYGGRMVAAPVRIADAAAAALLRPGDVVDVLAAAVPDAVSGPSSAAAPVVAAAVSVLVVPREAAASFGGGGDMDSGALVVVAATDAAAARLAAAAVTSRISMVIRSHG